MKSFKGLIPPMITCFAEDESIDEKATREHINFLIDNRVHAIIVAGSTGEFANLTPEEHRRVLTIAIDEIGGRVPAIAGAAQQSTRATVEMCRFAEKAGANAVMVVPPYYSSPTPREIYEHFKSISKAVSIPLALYNNVWTSGVDVHYALIAKMIKEDVIQIVKEAHGDDARIYRIKHLVGDKGTVIYGNDPSLLGAYAMGADGHVGGIANLLPAEYVRMYELCVEQNNYVEARKLWYQLIPMTNFCCTTDTGVRADWMQAIKEGLAMRGRNVGKARRPYLPLTEDGRNRLKTALQTLGYDVAR